MKIVTLLFVVVTMLLISCTTQNIPQEEKTYENDIPIDHYQTHRIEHMQNMNERLMEIAIDYQQTEEDDKARMIVEARNIFIESKRVYKNEKIIIMSMFSSYDAWIDDSYSNKHNWKLKQGETSINNPGSLFEDIIEPMLWDSQSSYITDVQTYDDQVIGLPSPEYFVAAIEALILATDSLQTQMEDWKPGVHALIDGEITMLNSLSTYFDLWESKQGEQSRLEMVDVMHMIEGFRDHHNSLSNYISDFDNDVEYEISQHIEELQNLILLASEENFEDDKKTYKQELNAKTQALIDAIKKIQSTT